MSLGLCQYENNKSMCAYCSKKEEYSCRCDKNTDVIWGEITGELKDQTDLQAALDKCIADILTTDTLAHTNETRLDTVAGTANESNQRSKDNLLRLDIVQGTADAAKVLADKNNNELATIKGIVNNNSAHISQNETLIKKVEATANEADALSKEDRKLIDTKSDIGHTHSQISNGSTVISTTDKKAVITAPATDIQDTDGMPIIQTRKNNIAGSEIGSLVFIGDKNHTTGKCSDIILNGDSIGDGMKLINQRVYSFDLDLTTDAVQNKKWLPYDFAFPISTMFFQYLNMGDYPDGLGEAQDLMAISGAQIHPTLRGKFWKDSQQKVAHFQHFKPWTIHFYDAIQQYDSIQYTESTPILEIEVSDDTSKYMEQINGLSDVKYLRLNNSSSTTLEWLFINSNNEQVGSFTIQ